jgi:hypothetical protein
MAGTDFHLSRRRALGLGGIASIAAGWAATGSDPAASDRAAARRLGLAYVADHGVEAASALLASAFDGSGNSVPADLADRVSNDFRAGRTLTLRGYLLSESEVAACLVAAGVRVA